MAPKRYGIHFKPQSLMQKTCLFYVSETLAVHINLCLCTQRVAYVRRFVPVYTNRGFSLAFIFQK